jgi:hypothetical protein
METIPRRWKSVEAIRKLAGGKSGTSGLQEIGWRNSGKRNERFSTHAEALN